MKKFLLFPFVLVSSTAAAVVFVTVMIFFLIVGSISAVWTTLKRFS